MIEFLYILFCFFYTFDIVIIIINYYTNNIDRIKRLA